MMGHENSLMLFVVGIIMLIAPFQMANASVYVAAHPDDIELFMGNNAANDLIMKKQTVFILLTAGDDGNGDGPNDKPKPYYRARLDGHERAIRFWMSLTGHTVPQTINTYETIYNKKIEKHIIGDVIIYNLNLPDGNVDGSGFQSTNYQSLEKLYSGRISKITSITLPSFSYTADELKEMLRQLIVEANRDVQDIWLNIQDENTNVNINDHSDHTSTAKFVLEAFSTSPYNCVNITRYLDYIIAFRPMNMNDDEKLIHVGTWGALNSGLVDGGNQNTWDVFHNHWLGKEYYRIQKSGMQCKF